MSIFHGSKDVHRIIHSRPTGRPELDQKSTAPYWKPIYLQPMSVRLSIYPPLCLHICRSLCLSLFSGLPALVFVPFCVPVCVLSVTVYLSADPRPSVYLHTLCACRQCFSSSISLCVCLCLYPRMCLRICMSVFVSLSVSVCLCLCVFVCVYLSISLWLSHSIKIPFRLMASINSPKSDYSTALGFLPWIDVIKRTLQSLHSVSLQSLHSMSSSVCCLSVSVCFSFCLSN